MIKRKVYKEINSNPQLIVSFRAPFVDLIQLWKLCRETYNHVVNKLVEQSTVVTYNREYICPHCVLTERPIESSYKLPLAEVMESKCSNQCDALCLNEDIPDRKTYIPAAFLAPITQGKAIVL